jgi:hypothetical protein
MSAISKIGRGAVLGAAMISMSSILELTGLPFCSAIGGVAQTFAAAQSEAKKLRDKAAACLRQGKQISAMENMNEQSESTR